MAGETLHGLPPEVIIDMFKQLPDLKSVESMALTCSKFQQVYRDSRRSILAQIALNQYGDLIPEAIAAVRSEGLFFQDHEEEAIALLDTRRRHKEIFPRGIQPNIFTSTEEIVKLLRLNDAIQYFMNAFKKPYKIPKNDGRIVTQPLSDMEKRRFSRAMLRIQTHCNIFGKKETHLDVQNSQALDLLKPSGQRPEPVAMSPELIQAKEYSHTFMFGPMTPWEMEEFACVWSFFQQLSASIVHDVFRSFYQLTPEHPDKELELQGHIYEMKGRIDGLTPLLIGPMFLHRFFCAEPLDRLKMLMANAHESGNKRALDVLASEPSFRPGVKRLLDPVKESNVDSIQKIDKMVSQLTDLDRPNLGWIQKVKHWPRTDQTDGPFWNLGERFPNDSDWRIINDPDWKWGYAIWDDDTLPWAKYLQFPGQSGPPAR